jgi:hypothetical protein
LYKVAEITSHGEYHTMDQYLSPLRYFLIITIVRLQYNAQFYFCSVKLDFSISYINPASKSLQSTEISLYLAFTNELNFAQKEKKY